MGEKWSEDPHIHPGSLLGKRMRKTSDEGTIIFTRPLKILKTIIIGKWCYFYPDHKHKDAQPGSLIDLDSLESNVSSL